MTDPQREEAATMLCDCDTAQEYQQAAVRAEEAKERIRELAGDAAEEPFQQPVAVQMILESAVEELCKEEIDAITVAASQELKYKLSRTAKGNIKIVPPVDHDALSVETALSCCAFILIHADFSFLTVPLSVQRDLIPIAKVLFFRP